MSARAFVIRFPNGDFEYDFRVSAVPLIGDTIRRMGVLWRVTRITQEITQVLHVVRADARKLD